MGLELRTQVLVNSAESVTEGSGSLTERLSLQRTRTWFNGTGEAGATKQWSDDRTLGASADSLDVAGGVTNRLGATLTFTKIRLLVIKAGDDNTGPLVVGGGSNALAALAGAAIPVRPGGLLFLEAPDVTGLAVTAGTGDIIQVDGTEDDTYEIYLAGE